MALGLETHEEKIPAVIGGSCFSSFLATQGCRTSCAVLHDSPEKALHLLSTVPADGSSPLSRPTVKSSATARTFLAAGFCIHQTTNRGG